jgi:hypothetical protein
VHPRTNTRKGERLGIFYYREFCRCKRQSILFLRVKTGIVHGIKKDTDFTVAELCAADKAVE